MTATQDCSFTDKSTRREDMVSALADGIDALISTGGWQRYLDVQAKFRTYSFANTMLILAQRPHATQVTGAGRRDPRTGKPLSGWLALGRTVKDSEREHAIWIWAPSARKTAAEDSDGGQERVRTSFIPVPVYDVSQTEGEPLPEPVARLDGEDPQGYLGRLQAVAFTRGFDVVFAPQVPGYPGANGLCESGEGVRRITVATEGRSPAQQVKTLIHELAHAELHSGELAALPRWKKELEAESTAYVAGAALGLDTSGYSFGYVASWAKGDAARARKGIKSSAKRIQRCAAGIVKALEDQAAWAAEVSGAEATLAR